MPLGQLHGRTRTGPKALNAAAKVNIFVACEQALCLGKNSEERKGTKGLFTG